MLFMRMRDEDITTLVCHIIREKAASASLALITLDPKLCSTHLTLTQHLLTGILLTPHTATYR